MNIQNANNSNFITENKNRILFLFVLFLLSSIRMFGQTAEVAPILQNNKVIEVEINQDNSGITSIDTQMDFVGWFMGSRQSQMNETGKTNQSSTTTKKQILSSGITPNKVLYRTFMKRVISQDNAIV